ncbi:MAG: hypothetical protein IH620_04680 [Ignavibacterium sp.]|nr:hypothetical protein [Ignavibacterium sp.]
MKVLALESELKNFIGADYSKVLMEEAKIIFDLYKQNIIREIYFNDKHCAVIVLECDSLDHCKSILSTLPLVDKGFIAFEIMELRAYTGFDRIIKE